jgi:hypothetical protein
VSVASTSGGAGWEQRVADEVQQDQAELVGRPAGGGEKAQARSWWRRPASRTPVSIPVTVRWPGWVRNPATRAWKVRKVG